MKTTYIAVLFLFNSFFYNAQLVLGGNDPQDLVTHVLSGSGVVVSNVYYFGDPDAISYFHASTNYMSINAGLLMTTGSKYYALGPNNKGNAGILHNSYSYQPLKDMLNTNESMYDAAIIRFNLVPSGNLLKLTFQFGSEEYNEYVTVGYNDAFGIFIEGGQYSTPTNFALLPNNKAICIENIHFSGTSISNIGFAAAFPELMIHNGTGNEAPYNSSPSFIQYDDLTKPITSQIDVTPNTSYTVTLVIADVKDGIFDSGVFIKEGGLTASVKENELAENLNVYYNHENMTTEIVAVDLSEAVNYQLIDISGKIIESGSFMESHQIDMSSYGKGIYLLNVVNSKNQNSFKLLTY